MCVCVSEDRTKDNKDGRHLTASRTTRRAVLFLKESRVRAVSASDWHKIDHVEVFCGERERGEGLGGLGGGGERGGY